MRSLKNLISLLAGSRYGGYSAPGLQSAYTWFTLGLQSENTRFTLDKKVFKPDRFSLGSETAHNYGFSVFAAWPFTEHHGTFITFTLK